MENNQNANTPSTAADISTQRDASLCKNQEQAFDRASHLRNELAQFTGTQTYYGLGPLFRNAVYTDGVHFLIEHAQCAWLVTDAMAWVTQKIPGVNYTDGFMVIALHPQVDGSADVVITDGNDKLLHEQHYIGTTFPLAEGIKMFAVWGGVPKGPAWVLMLTHEY